MLNKNTIDILSASLNPHRLLWSLSDNNNAGTLTLGETDTLELKVGFELIKGALSDSFRYRLIRYPHNPHSQVIHDEWVTGVPHDRKFISGFTKDMLSTFVDSLDIEKGLNYYDRAWSVVSTSKGQGYRNVYVHKETVNDCSTRFVLSIVKDEYGSDYDVRRVAPDGSESQLYSGPMEKAFLIFALITDFTAGFGKPTSKEKEGSESVS